MMNCSACGKELPNPIDAYGLEHEPRCWDCYINDYVSPAVVQNLNKMMDEFLELAREVEESHNGEEVQG